MTDNPIDPTSHQPIHPHKPVSGTSPGSFGKNVHDFDDQAPVYKTWAGMKFTKQQWKLFMNYLAQNAITQVKKDDARMKKALRKLRKEETR